MKKTTRRIQKTRSNRKLFVAGALAMVLVVGSFTIASGSIIETGNSLIQSAAAALTGRPMIIIKRDDNAPAASTIQMGSSNALAMFDISVVNATHWATLRSLPMTIQITGAANSPLSLKDISMQYQYCIPSGALYGYGYRSNGCGHVTITPTAVSKSGNMYIVTFNTGLYIYPQQTSGIFTVFATPMYGYTGSVLRSNSGNASLQVRILSANAAADQCQWTYSGSSHSYGYTGCVSSNAIINIQSGAGALLTVKRPYGYGYAGRSTTVPPGGRQASVTTSLVTSGSNGSQGVGITTYDPNPNQFVWAALIKQGSAPIQSSVVAAQYVWVYVNSCNKTHGGASPQSSNCTMALPSTLPAGYYYVELFGDDTYAHPLAAGSPIFLNPVGTTPPTTSSSITVSLVSADAIVTTSGNGSGDIGTFTMRFKVSAVGGDAYLSNLSSATLSGVTPGKTSITVDRSGTALTDGVTTALTNNHTSADTATPNAAGLWKISNGSSQTFSITTSVKAGTTGLYRVSLDGLSWSSDPTNPTPNQTYTSDLSTFKTNYVNLQGGAAGTPPAPMQAGVSVSASSVVAGSNITVSPYMTSGANSGVWIALFRQGDAPTQENLKTTQWTWVYMNSCSTTRGSSSAWGDGCTPTIPATLPAGTYYFELFGDSTYNQPIAKSAPFQVTAPVVQSSSPTISVNPNTMNPGGSVTISWSNISNPSIGNWIALMKQGATYNDSGLSTGGYTWFWTDSCSKTQNAGAPASGQCQMTIPSTLADGTYMLQFFGDSTYNTPTIHTQITVTAAM